MKTGIGASFERQAEACDDLGSPFTARICSLLPEGLDPASQTGRRVLEWSGDLGGDAVALRLCGALHRLVLEGKTPDLAAAYPPNKVCDRDLTGALKDAIRRHDAAICRGLDLPPQTNEVARSGALLPGLMVAARDTGLPLSLREIGSSAGLNLRPDRYFYRYGSSVWGDPSSGVSIEPDMRGAVPTLDGSLLITDREGCDIAPIDASNDDDRRRLRSFVWADQAPRLARLDAALAIAAAEPVTVSRTTASAFVDAAIQRQRAGETLCVFHSIVWQYLPAAEQNAVARSLDAAGEAATSERPLAHLRLEPGGEGPGAALFLTLWPGARTKILGRADFHGRWLDWS